MLCYRWLFIHIEQLHILDKAYTYETQNDTTQYCIQTNVIFLRMNECQQISVIKISHIHYSLCLQPICTHVVENHVCTYRLQTQLVFANTTAHVKWSIVHCSFQCAQWIETWSRRHSTIRDPCKYRISLHFHKHLIVPIAPNRTIFHGKPLSFTKILLK